MNQHILYLIARNHFNRKIADYVKKHGKPPSQKTEAIYLELILTSFGVEHQCIDNYLIVDGKILMPIDQSRLWSGLLS